MIQKISEPKQAKTEKAGAETEAQKTWFSRVIQYWWFTGILIALVFAVFTRVYGVTQFPPSLYWEEVALGYDAYSILKTGKDHHGTSWPLVAFESFGDYKPSLYFYAVVPSIALFGLSEFAVRLPSIISGILLVIAIGLLAGKLFARQFPPQELKILQVIAVCLTALSPWAIQFSRAAWEVNLATCLVAWAVYFGWPESKLMEKQDAALRRYGKEFFKLLLSMFLFALSMYAYHSTRVISPLLAGMILVMWLVRDTQYLGLDRFSLSEVLRKSKGRLLSVLLAGVFLTILVLPVLLSAGEKTTQQRFAETSILADGEVLKNSGYFEYQERSNSLLTKLMYHRYWFNAHAVIQNYLRHLSLDFLFITGDANPRHSLQFVGQLYLLESILLLLGIYALFKNWRREYFFLIFWLGIGILPAALTRAAPHALRILPTLPVWMLLVTLGWHQVWQALSFLQNFPHFVKQLGKNASWITVVAFLGIFVSFYALHFGAFWRFYSKVYPNLYAEHWQYGYKEMIQQVSSLQKQHPELPVYISRSEGRPAMYYWFYTQTDPREVQESQASAKKDQSEFLEFNNIRFVGSLSEVSGPAITAAPANISGAVTKKHWDVELKLQ